LIKKYLQFLFCELIIQGFSNGLLFSGKPVSRNKKSPLRGLYREKIVSVKGTISKE